MSARATSASSIAPAVKQEGEEAPPPTMLAAYVARLRCKQTRGGTALRSLLGVVFAAGAVAAVRWDRGRQYQAGYRAGQSGDGEGFDP